MFKVYFIGAGPGDPQLMTLKGVQLLSDAELIFAPDPYEETFAALLQGKPVFSPFDYDFEELTALVEKQLLATPVAFLIPGDLTFYAPFQALIDHFGERSLVVPGVGVANAASAHLKRTLDLPGVCNRAIIVSPKTLGNEAGMPSLSDLAGKGASLLIYMNNMPLAELCSTLRKGYGEDVPITLLHRLGLPGEETVSASLDTICAQVGERDYFNLDDPSGRPALTLVIVGETLKGKVDGSWWNYRRENIWKKRKKES